jgi:farnesyl-diphosphate farnesyltransferase
MAVFFFKTEANWSRVAGRSSSFWFANRGREPMPSTSDLLLKTSRTFALAIPLLPEPTRTTVCLAYLLFRIADTLEDAESWPKERRVQGLIQFCELLRAPDLARARQVSQGWLKEGPTRHDAYLELLDAVPQVLAEVGAVSEGARQVMLTHPLRTADGMRRILEAGDAQGRAQIASVKDLQDYCYVVAGIVGELLTDLFLNDAPALKKVAGTLHEHKRAFGEALQLVNILKDEAVDDREGRRYLPAGVDRDQVIDLARSDLIRARTYIEALWSGGGPPGFFAFTALSEQLAQATLDRIEEDGAGAKVSRPQVMSILARVQKASAAARTAGRSPLPG